jgi:hemerythrin superfamily protein
MPSRPDAIALLKADHSVVKEKFARFKQLGERATKSKVTLVADVVRDLSVHAAIEEQIFYPAVRERMPDEEDAVLEALEEHHVVKWTLAELESMTPQMERFDAKFTVLMESVQHHIREEEAELFPKVRKAFTKAELIELGELLVQARQLAPERPHPRAPDQPPMNAFIASLSKPVDQALDKGRALGRSAVRTVRRAVRSH